MRECDKIVSDPEGHEEIQVKAMAVLVRAVKVCYSLVTDAEVEMLEKELKEIKRRIADRDREDKKGP